MQDYVTCPKNGADLSGRYRNDVMIIPQLQVAVGSGFRNSGITCGKKGKIMLVCHPQNNYFDYIISLKAIRSTHSLEVPVMYGGQLIVNQEVREFVCTW